MFEENLRRSCKACDRPEAMLKLLSFIAASPEPLHVSLVGPLLSWDDGVVAKQTAACYALFPLQNHCFRAFHKKLMDFLMSPDRVGGELAIDVRAAHAELAEKCYLHLFDDSGAFRGVEEQGESPRLRLYSMRHVMPHCTASGSFDRLGRVVSCLPFMVEMCIRGLAFELANALSAAQAICAARRAPCSGIVTGVNAWFQLNVHDFVADPQSVYQSAYAMPESHPIGASARSDVHRWGATRAFFECLSIHESSGGLQLLKKIDVQNSVVHAFDVSSDNALIVTGSEGRTLSVWHASTGEPVSSSTMHGSDAHDGQVLCCALSRDGSTIASGGSDHVVKLWSEKCVCLHECRGHSGSVYAIRFNMTGKLVASGSGDSRIIIWDVRTGSSLRSLDGHSQTVVSCDFSSEDEAVLVSGSADSQFRVWNCVSGSCLRVENCGSARITCVVLSAADRWLACGRDDGQIVVWFTLSSSSAAAPMFLAHSSMRTVVLSCGFSPDAQRLVSSARDGRIVLWDVAHRSVLSVLHAHSQWLQCAKFFPDGMCDVYALTNVACC